jgi:hypothetical protein
MLMLGWFPFRFDYNKIIFHFSRLIEISEELEELDLDENVIGHVCGSIILDALKSRKESKCQVFFDLSEEV